MDIVSEKNYSYEKGKDLRIPVSHLPAGYYNISVSLKDSSGNSSASIMKRYGRYGTSTLWNYDKRYIDGSGSGFNFYYTGYHTGSTATGVNAAKTYTRFSYDSFNETSGKWNHDAENWPLQFYNILWNSTGVLYYNGCSVDNGPCFVRIYTKNETYYSGYAGPFYFYTGHHSVRMNPDKTKIKGKYYVMIAYFADGSCMMSDVKKK